LSTDTSIETRMNAFKTGGYTIDAPIEDVDGVNTVFTFGSYDPASNKVPNTFFVTLNGLIQEENEDYTINEATGEFTYSYVPANGSRVRLHGITLPSL